MDTQHTPGPWHVETAADRTLFVATRSEGRQNQRRAYRLARVTGSTAIGDARQRFEADARLRALLATSDLNFDSLEPDTVRAIQAARAVIAKVNS